MYTIMRRCDARETQVRSSKVKVTLKGQMCPVHNFVIPWWL